MKARKTRPVDAQRLEQKARKAEARYDAVCRARADEVIPKWLDLGKHDVERSFTVQGNDLRAIARIVEQLEQKARSGEEALKLAQAYGAACSRLTDLLTRLVVASGHVLDDADLLQRESSLALHDGFVQALDTACADAVAYCPSAFIDGPEGRYSARARQALDQQTERFAAVAAAEAPAPEQP